MTQGFEIQSAGRFTADEKRLVNCNAVDVNQLMPLKYNWAWEHYLNGTKNHWMPSEVPMHKDIETWRSGKITANEQLLIMRNLGFFSTAESLVGNNLVLAIFKHVTNAECRQYLLRQAFEEAVHTHTFLYVVESLGLNESEIFNMYREIPTISEKDEFEMRLTRHVLDPNFTTEGVGGLQEFLRNLIGYYIIMEGIFFYTGFLMVLSLHRRNMMKGIGEQFQYILRDETIHLNFGIDLINGIKAENPEVWDEGFQEVVVQDVLQGVDLEVRYAEDCLPVGILGLTAEMFRPYVEYIADRRLERIGLPRQFGSVKMPEKLKWMSEVMDLPKEKNFFESTVTDYQQGSSLVWDDEED